MPMTRAFTRSPVYRRRSPLLAAAVSAALACGPSIAQAQGPEEVIVTATRRAEGVQSVPLNITAVSGDALQEQGITDLAEIGRTVPGLFVLDQGARASNQIIVRGLNADPIASTEALGNTGGGTVATYVGDIPLYVDLKLEDMERVEVLLGPQGTLYGAGTLGGAIRYIPRRPQFDETSVQLRGDGYMLAESDGFGTDVGLVGNFPLSDTLALRASVGYRNDPGFVDYNYLVREPGVSDPEPDFSDPAAVAANLRRKEDADDEQTMSGRVGLRWQPIAEFDMNLTYFFQDQEVGGRTISSRSAFGTGKYESGLRFEEPNDRRNELLALEATADLGFAELTSATGYSEYDEKGGRDQTDLLITLEFSYEAFPSFAAFTRETQQDETFNQELRLVSKHEGPLSWIVGAFYNKYESEADSAEFTPLYAEYLQTLDPTLGTRPDALEYYSYGTTDLRERALYGELTYQISDAWQVTIGGRYYKYDVESLSGFATPLFSSVFDGAGPDEILLDLDETSLEDSGSLFKFNTSYDISADVMAYVTVSEGYRFGNSNGINACPVPLPPNQILCAQPDEISYFPDTTTNYEVGLRSQWLDGRVLLNGSIFFIDWEGPQLASTTENGGLPITRNGQGAESRGFDVTFGFEITPALSVRGSYAYTDAKLTEDAFALFNEIVPPGFGTIDVDGEAGDRLPGSPEHQGTFFVSYEMPVFSGFDLDLNYGISALSNILSRTGGRAGGETLGGFAVHSASAMLRADTWTLGLYAKNLLNKYAKTGVRSTSLSIQTVADENGDPVQVRSYYHDLLRPREVGVRFTYDFGL